jgi:ABC transporter, phosphonate, periplasmic substrate-binding protein
MFLLLIEGIGMTTLTSSQHIDIYYYYPDSPQINPSQLKRGMEGFLTNAGFSATFQPFTYLVDLENQIQKNPPAFLIVPEWYLHRYGAKLHLHPLLVPVRQGRTSYRKILLGTKNIDLKFSGTLHLTLAMTSMGPNGDGILNTVLFTPRGVDGDKVSAIIVPKDTDALFALALGQVDMALVTRENMELVAKINPSILHSVHPLLDSDPIPMPVLCNVDHIASSTEIGNIKKLFLNAKKLESFSTVMEMLQINEWQAANN